MSLFQLLNGFLKCITVLVLLFSMIDCNTVSKQKTGEQLANKYCGSCHLKPDPQLATKKIWAEGILPQMGLRLGIGDRNELLSRISFKQLDDLSKLGIYPETPLVSKSDWEKISAYYIQNSTDNPMAQPQTKPLVKLEHLFSKKEVFSKESEFGITTMVKILPIEHQIWVGNRNKEVEIYDAGLQLQHRFRTASPIVDMYKDESLNLLAIGDMYPTQEIKGKSYHFDLKSNRVSNLIDSLHRPVEFKKADFNNDGFNDLVVAEFGFETGELVLQDGKSGSLKKIHIQAGPRNIILRDINADGRMDMYVLFAQAREQVIEFINKGNFKFSSRVVLEFSSIDGSSYLDMKDMDKDGLEDMIISNGDNADYSLFDKPFHGVRIYSNKGDGNFKETFFYPAYGATKTMAADFDEDGDMDMVMIAFFPSGKTPRSFLYFQHQSDGTYTVSDLGVPFAHWLVMDIGDTDADGDIDIILGNFQLTTEKINQTKKGYQLMYLQNSLK